MLLNIEEAKINKKFSLLKTCIIFLLSVAIICIVARYISNDDFRSYINRNVFKSEVEEDSLNSIDIDNNSSVSIYAYDKYITVLSENELSQYDDNGVLKSKTEVNISKPLMDASGKYFVLAEESGKKIYLVSGAEVIWERDLEGEISRVSVNKNGYVSVVIKNTAYKSKVIVFDNQGTDLFTVFLSKNYAICTALSDNNKYLAIGEVSYSGTILKSGVNIYSVEKAVQDPKHAVINSYTVNNGELVLGISYHGSDNAICRFDSHVQKVTKDSNERLYDVSQNDLFVDTNLDSEAAIINRASSGMFTYEYQINFKETTGKSERMYILNQDVPSFIVAKENTLAVSFGHEVEFINTSGWLKKKYISNGTVNSLVLGNHVAGVIYKNKIVVIKL